MGKTRSPNRDKAFRIYKENNGRISAKEIAESLGEKVTNIYSWKNIDCWEERLGKPGAPKGNRNAKGNKGGAPKGNLNNLKHGNYCDGSKFLDKGFLQRYIPAATKSIIKGIIEEGVSTLDMLWDNIMLCYTSIIRSQKIMHVKTHDDLTKELKRSKEKSKDRKTEKTNTSESEAEYEYELQFAWDKQERFLKAQAAAQKTLTNLIKEYEELLHKNWDMATEEQRLRIENLKNSINKDNNNEEIENQEKKQDAIMGILDQMNYIKDDDIC